MQGKSRTRESHAYGKWDIIGPMILIAIFGFCFFGGDNFFFAMMAVFFTAIMSFVIIDHRSSKAPVQQMEQEKPREEGSVEKELVEKPTKQEGSSSSVSQDQYSQGLERAYVGKTILLGFDDISVAEACLEFLKKQGVELPEPYDRLYAALNDPFWGKKTAERILDFMNKIAPKGSKFREINKNAWGFA